MIEVPNRSDFIITLTIRDKDLVVIPYQEIDWEAQYQTGGNVYKVGCKSGVLTSNCEVIGSSVHIYVNKFDWGRLGQVRRRIFVSFPDPRFGDGTCDIHTPESLTGFKIV